jgi:hypothetical protein
MHLCLKCLLLFRGYNKEPPEDAQDADSPSEEVPVEDEQVLNEQPHMGAIAHRIIAAPFPTSSVPCTG